ncbi:MAG: serine/threonine protein kinase [Planctomycetota bacterium]|nr:MAG: serine/threonine protein kinase [Planctomycetota bacterium]
MPSSDDVTLSGPDRAIAQLLRDGAVTRAQVDECLQRRREAEARGGAVPSVMALLVAAGYLATHETLRATPAAGAPHGGGPKLPEEARAAAAEPRNAFGRYVRVSRLGSGGMGEVWKGWDRELGRWVALKFLKQDDPAEIARFEREARLVAGLSHPNIASVYEIGERDGRHFIAMQLVPGATLSGRWKGPLRDGVRLLRDASRAVQHAHEQGVIHRDLKPANLMADPAGRVYVMDFGLARPAGGASSISATGSVVGTPGYMAPEQAEGGPAGVDARADVYGLGATLYEMFTGRPPFSGKDVYEILMKVAGTDPVPPRLAVRGLDPDLDTIVLRCLEKERERRYASAAELADDLDRWLEGRPIVARPASAIYLATKWARRHRALVTVGAFGLFLAAGIAAYLGPKLFAEKKDRQRAEREKVEQAVSSAETEEALRELGALQADILLARQGFSIAANDPVRVTEKLQKAVAAVGAFLARHPGHPQALYVRARGRLYLGELAKAEEDLADALKQNPGFAPAHALRGRVFLEKYRDAIAVPRDRKAEAEAGSTGLVDAARASLAKGLAPGTGEDWARRWGLTRSAEEDESEALSRALLEAYVRRDTAAACRILEAAHAKEPSAELLQWRAHFAKDAASQLSLVEEGLSRMPLSARLLLDRSALSSERGDAARARKDLDAALRVRPGYVPALFNRAFLSMAAADWPAAVADLDLLLASEPRHADALNNRGHVKRLLRDFSGAISDFDAAIAVRSDATYLLNRALVRCELRQWDSAHGDLEEALKRRPGDPEILLQRGVARTGQGRADLALADYDAVIREGGAGAAIAWFNRGAIFVSRKDRAEAIRCFDEALKLNQDYAGALAARGFEKFRNGDRAGGAADLDAAIAKNPDLCDARFSRGLVRMQLKRLGEAAEDFTAVIRLDPSSPDGYYLRSVCLEDTGDIPGAIRDAKKALEVAKPDWPQKANAEKHLKEVEAKAGR